MPEVEAELRKVAAFPRVLGALFLSGCHVAVCDSSRPFTYCFVGYPGDFHDQRIFANVALVNEIH